MKKAKILVIGSYLAGLTMRMQSFPVAGETVIGEQYQAFHGGKGSNQAVACARLGAEVAFAGCIGDDGFGKNALALFERENVGHSATRVLQDAPTGVGFILVNAQGENMITLDTGACRKTDTAFVEELRDMIKEYDIVLMQEEVPAEAVIAAARLTRQLGKQFILNPAPYVPLPDEIYACVDVIVPNEGEARRIVGLAPEDDSFSTEAIAEKIRTLGVGNVVITLGSKGAYFRTADDAAFLPAEKVKAVDTTGAGDTFTAALSVALGEGQNMRDAVRMAQHAAAVSVCSYGVIESLPYRSQL